MNKQYSINHLLSIIDIFKNVIFDFSIYRHPDNFLVKLIYRV